MISPSVPGTVSSGTLSARAPGQTPRMPIPFCGAAATDTSPCRAGWSTGVAGERGDVRIARPLGVRDVGGGVHERDQRALSASPAAASSAGSATHLAPVVGRAAERVAGTPSGLRRTLACGVDEQAACAFSAAANARARLRLTL